MICSTIPSGLLSFNLNAQIIDPVTTTIKRVIYEKEAVQIGVIILDKKEASQSGKFLTGILGESRGFNLDEVNLFHRGHAIFKVYFFQKSISF